MAASSGNMEILTPGASRLGMLGSLFVTLAIVAGIFLVTVYFAVKTEGGRAFVADRLGRRLGEEVTIGGARIGWPYALVVDRPVTRAFAEGKPGFRAQSLRMAFDLGGRLCLSVHRGELILVQDARGEWQPPFWGRLGDLPAKNIDHIERIAEPFKDRTVLTVTDSAIRWIDGEGREKASVAGLAFDMRPVSVPGRRMNYCRVSARHLADGRGRTADIDEREWLMSEADPFLPLRGGTRRDAAGDGAWFSIGETYDREEAGAGID